MARSSCRRVMRLARQPRELYLTARVARESDQADRCGHDRVLLYHSHQPASYVSVFGELIFPRAYFYRAGHRHCPLDTARSLPGRCDSDYWMELASGLVIYGVFEKRLVVLGRLLVPILSELALESWVRDANATVLPLYARKAAFLAEEAGRILVAQAVRNGAPMVRQQSTFASMRRSTGDKKIRKEEAVATGGLHNCALSARATRADLRAPKGMSRQFRQSAIKTS